MSKHLVLVGGGHAHLMTLKNLRDMTSRGHRVSLVSPTPFHDYSGMGPGLISGQYSLSEVRFNIYRMAQNGGADFIEAAATGLAPDKKQLQLSDGSTIDYDVISFNTGSRVSQEIPKTAIGRTIFPVKPVANLFHAREKILRHKHKRDEPLSLLVIGGGPAGCEVTGNLQELISREGVPARITIVAGASLLEKMAESTRRRTRELLATQPLQLLEGTRTTRLRSNSVDLEDGRRISFDYAFVASGITPAGPVAPEGLEVNRYLQSPVHPEIFGGGDCIKFLETPLDKVGVYAVRQNPILHLNLLAALEGTPLKAFLPQKEYLLIFNFGLNRAIAAKNGFSWSGRTARWLKSALDRQFVKKFQVI